MLTYNVSFINVDNQPDETQLDIKEYNREDAEIIELINAAFPFFLSKLKGPHRLQLPQSPQLFILISLS